MASTGAQVSELQWIKVVRARLREARLFDLHTRVLILDVWELMATTSEYGRLVTPDGQAMSRQAIAEAVPGDVNRNLVGLGKLVETGFLSVGADDVIYDHSMAHDKAVSLARSRAGILGGRPPKSKTKTKPKTKPKATPSSSLPSSVLGEGMQGEGGGALDGFERWWNEVARKQGKKAAKKAFPDAMAGLTERFKGDRPRALAWLIVQTQSHKRCKRTKDPMYTKTPGPWLNDEGYDEGPEVWKLGKDVIPNPEAGITASEDKARRQQDDDKADRARERTLARFDAIPADRYEEAVTAVQKRHRQSVAPVRELARLDMNYWCKWCGDWWAQILKPTGPPSPPARSQSRYPRTNHDPRPTQRGSAEGGEGDTGVDDGNMHERTSAAAPRHRKARGRGCSSCRPHDGRLPRQRPRGVAGHPAAARGMGCGRSCGRRTKAARACRGEGEQGLP